MQRYTTTTIVGHRSNTITFVCLISYLCFSASHTVFDALSRQFQQGMQTRYDHYYFGLLCQKVFVCYETEHHNKLGMHLTLLE